MKKLVFASVLIILFVACSKGYKSPSITSSDEISSKTDGMAKMETSLAVAEKDVNANQTTSQAGVSIPDKITNPSKIIKNANYRFQVDNVEKSVKNIEQIVKQITAYISNSKLSNSSYSIENVFTIRVPAEKMDLLMSELAKEALYTDYREVKMDDVTAEFVDIEARLKTKKEVEQRYKEVLMKKANTVREILDAEEAIRVVREEIEAKEGRLKFLKDQVSYSTINLEIYQKVKYADKPETIQRSFWSQLAEAFASGWHLIINIFLGIIYIWPLWFVFFAIWFLVRKWIQWRRSKK